MLLLHTEDNKMLVMTGMFLFKKCVQQMADLSEEK
jgi:hypothetical protein